MIKIAVDAMGGDNAPAVVVEGAVQAVKGSSEDLHIVLAGPQALVKAELQKAGYNGSAISIFNAPQIVEMDDAPTNVLKSKSESGLVSCVALQKKGIVQASISAGNSGAMMAACLMILGRAGKISRPSIACEVPSLKRKVVLLDCGANVDEKPINLIHFAICGSIYAEHALKYDNPKVALLNIGEEEKKGTETIQEAYKILKKAPLNFIGNVEGHDIIKGKADVVVTHGYTGNVILKLMEGFYELHHTIFGKIDTPEGRRFSEEWNYANTGGALLLGLNGTGIITHGRADAKVIKMAIFTAAQHVSSKVAEKISQKVEAFS